MVRTTNTKDKELDAVTKERDDLRLENGVLKKTAENCDSEANKIKAGAREADANREKYKKRVKALDAQLEKLNRECDSMSCYVFERRRAPKKRVKNDNNQMEEKVASQMKGTYEMLFCLFLLCLPR